MSPPGGLGDGQARTTRRAGPNQRTGGGTGTPLISTMASSGLHWPRAEVGAFLARPWSRHGVPDFTPSDPRNSAGDGGGELPFTAQAMVSQLQINP